MVVQKDSLSLRTKSHEAEKFVAFRMLQQKLLSEIRKRSKDPFVSLLDLCTEIQKDPKLKQVASATMLRDVVSSPSQGQGSRVESMVRTSNKMETILSAIDKRGSSPQQVYNRVKDEMEKSTCAEILLYLQSQSKIERREGKFYLKVRKKKGYLKAEILNLLQNGPLNRSALIAALQKGWGQIHPALEALQNEDQIAFNNAFQYYIPGK